jgi:lipoate-protein ligase B
MDGGGGVRHERIVSSVDSMPEPALHLDIRDLGRMPYTEALTMQRALQQEVIARRNRDQQTGYLLLVEHDPPVITVSRRAAAASHLLGTPAEVANAGVEVQETDRGGDITYHGPGQLVVYPILDLNRLELRLHGYMRWLEERVLGVLSHFGIDGQRDADATGVWVHDRKICAIGVRVSRWVSMHGLALNVDPDLSHFKLIVPCGLRGREVTTMACELGSGCPSMGTVKQVMQSAFADAM